MMKMMLKNEKNANQIMKQKIGQMSREMHDNNTLVRKLEQQVPGQRKP